MEKADTETTEQRWLGGSIVAGRIVKSSQAADRGQELRNPPLPRPAQELYVCKLLPRAEEIQLVVLLGSW